MGDLSDQALSAILRILSRTETSGVLSLAGPGGLASFILIDGRVLYATSSTVPDLGASLVAKGYIGQEILENVRAIKQRKRKLEPLGTVLMDLGLVERDVLEQEIEDQVLKVLRDAMAWDSGKVNLDLVDWRTRGETVVGARPVEDLLARVNA